MTGEETIAVIGGLLITIMWLMMINYAARAGRDKWQSLKERARLKMRA